MGNEIEELGIQIGFDIKWQELQDGIDSAAKESEKKIIEAISETAKRSSGEFSKEIDKGLSKNKAKIKKSADENIGKSIERSIGQSITRALEFAAGALIAKGFQKVGFVIEQTFRDAAKGAIAFEKGVAEVNSILDKNVKVTDEMSNSLLRFSSNYGTSQSKQVRSFYNIVSAGVKGASKQLDVLNVSNKAAVAGLVDVDIAAFAVVSAVNAYSSSGLTAAKASDILFRGVKEGSLFFVDLARSIGRVATVGSQLGLPFDQVIGSLSAITRTGLPAAETASALRQLFKSIINPSSQAATAIDDINQKLKDNVDKQVELSKITKTEGIAFLNKSLIDMSKDGVKAAGGIGKFLANLTVQLKGNTEATGTLFANMRAFTAVASATGDIKRFNGILLSVKDSAGATDAAFKILSNTLDFKLRKSVAILKTVGTVIFSSLVEPAKAAADIFLDNVGPAILTITGMITSSLPTFELFVNALKGAAKFLFNSLKLIGNSVSFAVLEVLKKLLFKANELFGNLPGIGDKIRSMLGSVVSSSIEAADGIDENLTAIKGSFDDVFKFGISDAAAELQAKLEDILLNQDDFTAAMKKKLKELIDGIKDSKKKANKEAEGHDAGGIIAGGISKGVQDMTKSLMEGGNIMDEFAKNFLATVGGMAIQVGTILIGVGVGKVLLPKDPGPGLIAAGAGLVAIGAVLTTFSGGGQQTATTGGGGGGAAAAQVPEELEPEERLANTTVNLNVEGSIFDGGNTARRLADLLNAGFDDENITLKQGF